MSEREQIREELGDEGERAEADARATAERLRQATGDTQAKIDRIGDEGLDAYDRRRARLESDLTGELPDDTPEPR